MPLFKTSVTRKWYARDISILRLLIFLGSKSRTASAVSVHFEIDDRHVN